jgi:hypothetical protein
MNWLARLWAWLRNWGDADLGAGPAPIIGITIGALLNTGLLLVGTAWWLRLLVVLVLAYLGRFTATFGHKAEGWHLETFGGAMLAEWGSWILFCHGPCS